MRNTRTQKLIRQAARASVLLGLALSAYAQTTGDETATGSAAPAASAATRPSSEYPSDPSRESATVRPGADEAARRDAAADSARPDRTDAEAGERESTNTIGDMPGDDHPRGMGKTKDTKQRSAGIREAAKQTGQKEYVRVGYDFDDDGRFDSFDYIRASDLDHLRAGSIRMRGGMAGRRLTDDETLSGPNAMSDRSREGEDTRTRGRDEHRLHNRMKSDSRRSVRADSERSGDLGGQEYSGRILSTRTAWFAGHDHDHLLACVELDDEGRVSLVDLGPTQNLTDYRFRPSDHITVTARDGCINGEEALIADELTTTDGQFVRLDNYEASEPLQLRGRPVGPSDEYDNSASDRGDWGRGWESSDSPMRDHRSFRGGSDSGPIRQHTPRSGTLSGNRSGPMPHEGSDVGRTDQHGARMDGTEEVEVDDDEIEIEKDGVETEINRDTGKIEIDD